MKRKNSLYISILAFLLILSFLFFSSPGLLSTSKLTIEVNYAEEIVEESSNGELIPLTIKVVHLVEGKPISKNPPLIAYIGVGVYTRQAAVNKEVKFYLSPGNYSLTVFLSDKRLPTWREIVKIDTPLYITVTYEETKYKPLRIEVVGNHTTEISRTTVTIGPIGGQRVYASLPVLYFLDAHSNLLKYPDLPESSDFPSALPYYIKIDQKNQTQSANDGTSQAIAFSYSFQFLVPAHVVYVFEDYTYVPILIINSTVVEVESIIARHH